MEEEVDQTMKLLMWGVTAVLGPFAIWVVNAISNLRATDKGQEVRLQYVERGVDHLWSNLIMNAQLKIAQQRPDLGGIHSPFTITPEARNLYDRHGFTRELHEFYLTEGQYMPQTRMEMEISDRFRARFMDTVCIEQGFSDMECIALAAQIAREANPKAHLKIDSDRPNETRLDIK